MIDTDDQKTIQDMIDKSVSKSADFPKRKRGDTPTDATQLTPKQYVDTQITSIYTAIGGGIIPADFGDGSDGSATLNGSTNFSWASIIAINTYSQTRDAYTTTLIVNSGIIWKPNLYRTFATISTHVEDASILSRGNNASSAIGGASITAGYFPSIAAGALGGGGGAGGSNSDGGVGGDGVAGSPTTHSFGINGVASRSATGIQGGAAAGHTPGVGGGAGSVASATPYITRPVPTWGTQYFLDVNADGSTTKMTGSAGSASGPGGGGGAASSALKIGGVGGDGGGAGSNGGIVALYSKSIILDAGSVIDVRGGDGAPGGDGKSPTGAGGTQAGGGAGANGGSGGQGGYIIFVYNTLSNSGTQLTAGGNFGIGGVGVAGANGGGTGGSGVAGFTGNAGSIMSFKITG